MKTMIEAVRQTLKGRIEDIAEGADAIRSAMTLNEVLKDIPMISIGVKVISAATAFREHLYVRNCAAFLRACKSADRERREKLWDKLTATSGRVEDFVDTLLLITTESSKPMKAAVVGHLVVALCNEKITYKEYDALVHIVHDASLTAMAALVEFNERTNGSNLVQSRNVVEEPLLMSMGIGYRYGTAFRISELGQRLVEHGLGGSTVHAA